MQCRMGMHCAVTHSAGFLRCPRDLDDNVWNFPAQPCWGEGAVPKNGRQEVIGLDNWTKLFANVAKR